MPKFYSPSNKGFYDTDLGYPQLPDDLIPISDQQHLLLLEGINMQGKAIVVTDDNKLILVTQPVVRTWEDIRAKRLRLLSETDYTQMQDWTGDKQAWAEYRQQLRDIPQQFDDPNNVVWPWPPTK